MKKSFPMALYALLLTLAVGYPAFAQDSEQPGDEDGSSERVESSDDAYRRRMELEDARRQDPSYTDPIDSYKKELEKIDKLPEESRENIRDQLVDVIVKNGEWEPSDALDEYPYEPTEAAKGDPVLMEQEQEAWEEQIEKYHEREAAAFGAYRGPAPGPGNPTGQQGGQAGSQGEQSGQQGQGNGQGQGSGQDGAGSPGTYEYQSNRAGAEDEVSTDGVSESALDFLKGRQGQGSASGRQASSGSQQGQAGGAQAPVSATPRTTAEEASSTDGALQSAAQWAAEQAESDPGEPTSESSEQAAEQQQATPEPEQEVRGIIAIEDLDKLEGAVAPEEDKSGSDTER